MVFLAFPSSKTKEKIKALKNVWMENDFWHIWQMQQQEVKEFYLSIHS